jgi:fatty-acyl-CoA synthase
MIEAFAARHGLRIVHAWGMTEMSPVGTVCHVPSALSEAPAPEQDRYRAKQGRPLPLVQIRARNDAGLVAWDGATMGELEVKGPCVASAYFRDTEPADRFTDDGWFRTGDVVTIDPLGTISIQDRSKDLIKSGGEWISSIALENALMAHPAVAEAAVVRIDDPKWGERPLAAVVLVPGGAATAEELRAFLARSFPRFWLPDAFEFIEAIPRTSAGKFQKAALRERFKDYPLRGSSRGSSGSPGPAPA